MSAAITRLVNTMSVLLLVMGVGCESPTRESQLPPPQPTPPLSSPAGYSLSGIVQDTAYRLIPDVRIQVVEGSQVGVSTLTDASGRFELPGTFTGVVVVQAEKAGYFSMTRRTGPGPYVGGRQGLFFDMALDAPSVNLTGDWNLTLQADGSCAAVPDVLRTRTYTASVAPSSFKSQNYVALLSGADIRLPRTELYVGVAGAYGSYYIDDPWGYTGGSYLLEKLAPSGYLAIWGSGEGSVSESMVSGSFRGSFEYCASSDSNLKCEVNLVQCTPSALTLVRR
jgi:Carboxypeptidase regulatory-like domain